MRTWTSALPAAEQRKDLAAQVAVAGMQECAGEGTEGSALAKKAVELMRELKQLPGVVQALKFALGRTPMTRMDTTDPNWTTVATLLRDLYTELGDTENAAQIQAQLDKAAPKKTGS